MEIVFGTLIIVFLVSAISIKDSLLNISNNQIEDNKIKLKINKELHRIGEVLQDISKDTVKMGES